MSTLLMVKLGLNFFLALPLSILGAMLISLCVSLPSLRLKGDYFILATIGFQVIVFTILYNWIGLTRGPYGIPGIPAPSLFGFEFSTLPGYFLLTLIISGLSFLVIRRILVSPFGRLLKAVREDELATQALGKDVFKVKVIAFLIAAGMAAISGSLFAHYVTYIDPTSFTLEESIFIATIIIVGGMGNMKGPVVGTVLLLIIPEGLRFIGIPDSVAANLRQMIYALLLIGFMYFRPQGIAGEYKFE
ncbi:MAG: branched-chain amino acid ABC transporter permease [bacterium]|nr:branched-chain amino acid ABC transporter permease [bacterium]